jgi:predicted nuclease with TOPRIM domain
MKEKRSVEERYSVIIDLFNDVNEKCVSLSFDEKKDFQEKLLKLFINYNNLEEDVKELKQENERLRELVRKYKKKADSYDYLTKPF